MSTMKINWTSFYLSFALFITLTSPLFFFTCYGLITTDDTQFINDDFEKPSENCNSDLTSEIVDMNSRLQKLELLLEKTELELVAKGVYISKYENQIEELSQTIYQLESNLSYVEESSDYEKEINLLEEQVQELAAIVKSNDKEIQLLKRGAKDSEDRVNLLAAQVKTMAAVVTELWFHIQKLEQAQEVIERRTAELRRHMRNQKCSFFKFVNNFGGRRYQEMVAPYTSSALNLLKISLSAAKKYHHQLQGVVKQEMNKHELTTVLAGEELVFLLASVIFVFPIVLAGIWLSSP